MHDGMVWERIPESLLVDCAQLVKANSIEGTNNLKPYLAAVNLLICGREQKG